jgi:hypothetical protein
MTVCTSHKAMFQIEPSATHEEHVVVALGAPAPLVEAPHGGDLLVLGHVPLKERGTEPPGGPGSDGYGSETVTVTLGITGWRSPFGEPVAATI